jgi:FkbM family methyltransferase
MRQAILFKKVKAIAKRFLKLLFRKLGISDQDQALIRALGLASFKMTISMMSKSRSQLRQDLFVIFELKGKKRGYFVEFGATNGIDLSNTYLLETEFSWTGILAEPARVWERQLKANRPNTSIETLCVWKDSNSSLTFNETAVAELSTVDSFSDKDDHRNTRLGGKKYEVQTISLNDLLLKHQAPKQIDYLSIDTEGSEYEILKAFNFNEFNIKIITVEHNYTPTRQLIFALLTSYGYKRKYEKVSHFDDWYVKS